MTDRHLEPKWPRRLTAENMYHRRFREAAGLLGKELPYHFKNLSAAETKELERLALRKNRMTFRWGK